LRRLHEELKFTSVFVTHDQQEAIEVADTIVVLNRGRIEQTGIPGDVYDLPSSAFVHRFLGQVNELPVTWRDGRDYVGPIDISGGSPGTVGSGERIALVRPHEIDIGMVSGGWPATIKAVRVIGPIVRVELCADGQSLHERLEAEVSREQFDERKFQIGQRVGVRLRQGTPASAAGPNPAAPAAA
jgi:sulfate transport system ATP-binding protein